MLFGSHQHILYWALPVANTEAAQPKRWPPRSFPQQEDSTCGVGLGPSIRKDSALGTRTPGDFESQMKTLLTSEWVSRGVRVQSPS